MWTHQPVCVGRRAAARDGSVCVRGACAVSALWASAHFSSMALETGAAEKPEMVPPAGSLQRECQQRSQAGPAPMGTDAGHWWGEGISECRPGVSVVAQSPGLEKVSRCVSGLG